MPELRIGVNHIQSRGITDVIQVCNDLSEPHTLAREVKGIKTAGKRLGIIRWTIVIYDQTVSQLTLFRCRSFSHNTPIPGV